MIALSGKTPAAASLSEVIDRGELMETSAYQALIAHAVFAKEPEKLSGDGEYLEFVAEDSVARHLEKLHVHAGGGAILTARAIAATRIDAMGCMGG